MVAVSLHVSVFAMRLFRGPFASEQLTAVIEVNRYPFVRVSDRKNRIPLETNIGHRIRRLERDNVNHVKLLKSPQENH